MQHSCVVLNLTRRCQTRASLDIEQADGGKLCRPVFGWVARLKVGAADQSLADWGGLKLDLPFREQLCAAVQGELFAHWCYCLAGPGVWNCVGSLWLFQPVVEKDFVDQSLAGELVSD